MGIVALKDVLAAFKTAGPAVSGGDAGQREGGCRAARRCRTTTAASLLGARSPSEPYLTAHVANALARAKDKGFDDPPANLIDRGAQLPAQHRAALPRTTTAPRSGVTITSLRALHAQAAGGGSISRRRSEAHREAGGPTKMNMEALAWLLGTLAGGCEVGG
jgi:hypothetical protein